MVHNRRQSETRMSARKQTLSDWLGLTTAPDWRIARWLGPGLVVMFVLLFVGAVAAAVALLSGTVFPAMRAAEPGESGGNLGTGALVVALLGAPFLIWSTVLKHRSWELQREGHMTDRISKAVEQLGAEKSISRIGRVLTVYEGKASKVVLPKGEEPSGAAIRGADLLPDFDDLLPAGLQTEWQVWPRSTTLLEYQGAPLTLPEGAHLAETGEWKAFAETVPNLEVRLGAILALERIAQDSMALDHGRDHVRVMEILCAYIRQNAPASMAVEPPVDTTCSEETLKTKLAWGEAFDWADKLPAPRSDIQLALGIIGRRSNEQIELEARTQVGMSSRYRLDLSKTCIQGANLSGLNLSYARLSASRLEGAACQKTNFAHSNFAFARLTGTMLIETNMSSVRLHECDLSDSYFNKTRIEDAHLAGAHFINVHFVKSHIEFAKLEAEYHDRHPAFIKCLFIDTQFEGDLTRIRFNPAATESEPVPVRPAGLAFRNAQFAPAVANSLSTPEQSGVTASPPDLRDCFGDGSVEIDPARRPAHWPTTVLDDATYAEACAAWQSGRPHPALPPQPEAS